MSGKIIAASKKLDNTLDNCYSPITIIDDRISMEAILRRDQRTTSHRVYPSPSSCSETETSFGVITNNKFGEAETFTKIANASSAQSSSSSAITENTYCKRITGSYRGSRGVTLTCLRLGSLLVTLLVATIHAAPTMNPDPRFKTAGKWVEPCGISPLVSAPSVNDAQRLTDEELLSPIVVNTKLAIVHAEIFKELFSKEAYNLNVTQLHEQWKSQHYDWLPTTEQIPKNLNESLDPKYLESLDLDTALVDAYQYMQTYAVALEQVVWDLTDKRPPVAWKKQFSETEYKLRNLLCEMHYAMLERDVSPRPDVDRSVMPDEFRSASATSDTRRNLRDWLIFRDYMNGLEYVEQVFEYFRKKRLS